MIIRSGPSRRLKNARVKKRFRIIFKRGLKAKIGSLSIKFLVLEVKKKLQGARNSLE